MSNLPSYSTEIVEQLDNGTCWVQVEIEGIEEPFWDEHAKSAAVRMHARASAEQKRLKLPPPSPLEELDLPPTRLIPFRAHVNTATLADEVRAYVETVVSQRKETTE